MPSLLPYINSTSMLNKAKSLHPKYNSTRKLTKCKPRVKFLFNRCRFSFTFSHTSNSDKSKPKLEVRFANISEFARISVMTMRSHIV